MSRNDRCTTYTTAQNFQHSLPQKSLKNPLNPLRGAGLELTTTNLTPPKFKSDFTMKSILNSETSPSQSTTPDYYYWSVLGDVSKNNNNNDGGEDGEEEAAANLSWSRFGSCFGTDQTNHSLSLQQQHRHLPIIFSDTTGFANNSPMIMKDWDGSKKEPSYSHSNQWQETNMANIFISPPVDVSSVITTSKSNRVTTGNPIKCTFTRCRQKFTTT